MKIPVTSLLLAILGLVVPPKNQPNLSLWNGKEMHILASLGAVSGSKQSGNTIEGCGKPTQSDPNENCQSHVSQMSLDFSDSVQVTLGQSHTELLQNRFQGPPTAAGQRSNTYQTPDCSDSRTESSVAGKLAEITVPSVVPPQSEDYLKVTLPRLPLDFILGPKGQELSAGEKLTERICARLVQLEAHESNTSLRSDYRQAFITVSLAAKGNPQAFLESSYAVYGIHPDKVWPRILANRKERLGREYFQFFDSNDLPRPDVKWDETVIYDLPSSAEGPALAIADRLTDASKGVGYSADSSLAANRAASPSTAAKGGDEPVTGRDLSPLPPSNVPNRKERLA